MLLATFTVTRTGDSGAGSLRQAILDANAAPDADVIVFAITEGEGAVKTIVPDSPLPALAAPVTVDGTTQPGYAGAPRIEIDAVHAYSNGEPGLNVGPGADGSVVRGLAVGRAGVGIRCSAPDCTIERNFLGTDASGTVSRFNIYGLYVNAPGCRVVGNVISGNSMYGVYVAGDELAGVVIAGNLIGVNATATAPLKNDYAGIMLEGPGGGTRVGGPGPADENVIGGNNIAGVFVRSAGNVIEGNLIGVLPDGRSALNGTGVYVVGGRGTEVRRNVIAYNLTGVSVELATRTGIVENRIFGNAGRGIDLDRDGVTPNDPGDVDAGGNGRQNFPVLASARSTGDESVIAGSLDGVPSSRFRVDFYANAYNDPFNDPTSADSNGYGEGARHVGSTEVTTDAAGQASFAATVAESLAGDLVTCTASRIDAGDLETSEFSRAVFASSASGPLVRRVFVTSMNWSVAFKSYAQQTGTGSIVNGFAVPAGPQQLAPLPWLRINQIAVEFNETVDVRPEQLSVRGNRVKVYGVNFVSFTTNGAHTATWTLAQPIENDRVVVRLDSDSPGGIAAGSRHLDGEWSDGTDSFPSGDGVPGGDFVFRMNVLAGDVTRSGAVLADDASDVKRRFFAGTTSPGSGAASYSLFADVNASGGVLADDFSEVKKRFFSRLPAAAPQVATVASAGRRLDVESVAGDLLR